MGQTGHAAKAQRSTELIPSGQITLEGELNVPAQATGVVLFAHGSGSKQKADTSHLRIGYFGSSTGGGAALVAAAELGEQIGAVVSRGGRPDLAGDALPKVKSPTLLIVGGLDYPVIRMNEDAYRQLRCERELKIVPGATHLFEEPGALEEVAHLAAEWFQRHLGASAAG